MLFSCCHRLIGGIERVKTIFLYGAKIGLCEAKAKVLIGQYTQRLIEMYHPPCWGYRWHHSPKKMQIGQS